MPRSILKCSDSSESLPSHEQSILNSLVYSKLCNPEIFSILSKVGQEQRGDALRIALDWALTHDLVADE